MTSTPGTVPPSLKAPGGTTSANGLYLHGQINNYKGMRWYYWKHNSYSVKRSEMKIRPKDF